ncbi:hypothetical protein A9P82_03790 [Arachidicoccus ginsenosidimutans]|uniref:single-stranded DNA-binding protein n=1 Tax=Arachidicoccus sp. BS20 TaxID=1850526 RepID=UPI0007F11CD5|nr:single-stranded DNA-binding protein [Arachidicoccus sp. BS20]ANI88496.1 hypothetical protein A9P82_03790 [Arachidicoccus sp. BS20]
MSTLRNRVQLIGHLGADPEVKTIESGAKLAHIRLATTENYRTQSGEWKEETTWHNVVAWENLAERMQLNLQKGSYVMIEGKLVNRSYTDASGQKKYISEVRAMSMIKLDKKISNNASPEAAGILQTADDDSLPF